MTFASSIPIAFLSYRRGLKVGVAAAFIVSVIQLLMGLNNLSYGAGSALAVISIIMVDYILPFTVIGFAGMFRSLNRKNTRIGQITTFGLGILTVMVLRFISCLLYTSITCRFDNNRNADISFVNYIICRSNSKYNSYGCNRSSWR